MSSKLFVIRNDDDGIVAFYTDLEKAKNGLKRIHNITINFQHYRYVICVYDLIDDEYVITNVSYTYRFDTFQQNDDTNFHNFQLKNGKKLLIFN